MPSPTFTILVFVTRKPGLSPSAFKSHYENKHIPLLKSLSTGPPSIFPISHTRRYLTRDPSDPAHPVVVLVGDPADFAYDAIAEVNFESEAAFREFQTKVMMTPKVAEDEERFTDRGKLKVVVLGETTVTRGD
jgi:EthD domain